MIPCEQHLRVCCEKEERKEEHRKTVINKQKAKTQTAGEKTWEGVWRRKAQCITGNYGSRNFTVLLKYGLGYSFSMNLCLYIVRWL